MQYTILEKTKNNIKSIKIGKNQERFIIDFVDYKTKGIIDKNISVGENSKLTYVFVLSDNVSLNYSENKIIKAGKNSCVKMLYCYFGNKKININLHNIIGENANIEHNVIYFGADDQEFNFIEKHEFQKPYGYGRFIVNGFIKDNFVGNCSSKIVINKNSQKVDSRLDLNAYISGNRANSAMVPGLEIKANDVKAAHSATVSRIDEDQIFYMQSRGLSKKDAENLFVHGIFNDFMSKFNHILTKEKILNLYESKNS